MLTAVNQSHPFWAFITPCYLVKYGKYLRLFTFNIWIKKSWMGNRCQWVWGVSRGLLGLWSTSWPSLCWSYHERATFFYFPLCCVRLCDGINRDVRNTVMILYVICQLMCGTDPWAHMSFMHSILSLKLGVIRVCGNPSFSIFLFGLTVLYYLIFHFVL